MKPKKKKEKSVFEISLSHQVLVLAKDRQHSNVYKFQKGQVIPSGLQIVPKYNWNYKTHTHVLTHKKKVSHLHMYTNTRTNPPINLVHSPLHVYI